MASEVGSAYLSILPSFEGGARSIARQLDGPMGTAGRSGGTAYGRGMTAGPARGGMLAAGGALGAVFAGAFIAKGLGDIAGAVRDYLGEAITSASNLSESQSKASQIFGESTQAVLAFAAAAPRALGQTAQQAIDGASTFAMFGKSAGLAEGDLAGFSTGLVSLATDLASFYNTSPQDAIDALGAALRGEAEPMRRYNVMLDDAVLKARAMELGIYDGTGSLTAQQKVLAAHAEILAVTGTQQGDFARTYDGLANQQRMLNAQMETFKTTIGTAVLPVVTDLVGLFSGEAVPALEELRKWISKNEDGIRTFVVAMVDLGLLGVEVTLALMAAWASFNDAMITVFTSVGTAFYTLADAILTGAEKAFGWMPGIGPKLAEMRSGFDQAKANADTNFRAMRVGADKVTAGFRAASDAVGVIREKVRALDGAEARVKVKIDQIGSVPSGAAFTGGIAKRASGGPIVAGQPYLVGEMGPELVIPRVSGTVLSAGTTTAASRVGGPVDLSDRSIARIAEVVVHGVSHGIDRHSRNIVAAGRAGLR